MSNKTLNTNAKLGDLIVWGIDGKTIATASASESLGLELDISPSLSDALKLDTGKRLFSQYGFVYDRLRNNRIVNALPHQLVLSQANQYFAFDVNQGVQIWQVKSGALYQTLDVHTAQVNTVAFSPDGKILASGSADKTIRLWDVASGQTIRVLSGHTESVNRVVFSPDGKFLVSASDDQTVRIWDVATGNLIKTLTGHTGAVTRVQWSPDGSLVASASVDGTIKVWEVSSGSLLTTLTGHTTAINDISWSPDGKTIASAGADATIRLWGVP